MVSFRCIGQFLHAFTMEAPANMHVSVDFNSVLEASIIVFPRHIVGHITVAHLLVYLFNQYVHMSHGLLHQQISNYQKRTRSQRCYCMT